MEKLCSVCGAPMIQVENGYKCSFCAHTELLGESDANVKQPQWTSYTSYTETEDGQIELPLNDGVWNAIPREKAEPVVSHDDVMVEVPMGNAPQGVRLPEQSTVPVLTELSKSITKNQPKWKKIVKIYIIIMIAQAVIPILGYLVFGLAGNGLFSNNSDFKITIDKSKFPVIEVPEVPEVDFEMPEIEVIMPDIEMPDFSYLYENAESKVYCYSVTMKSVLTEMFGKPVEEVTREDLQSIQFFMVEVDEEMTTMEVKYSTEDYSLYPEDYSDEVQSVEDITFGYSEEFAETIQTITVPFEQDLVAVYMDVALFENVKAINICKNGYVDLSQFPQLTLLDATVHSAEYLFDMNIPTEQIEVLRLNSFYFDDVDRLTGLKNLHIDGRGQITRDLSVLGNMPWLEELTIEDTLITDLNFLKGIPELRSLRLINNKLILDQSGLDSLEHLENLIVE